MIPRAAALFCCWSAMLAAGAWAAAAPAITGTSPDPFDAGGQAFLLTITGTGFVSGSVAKLSETALSTTFVSATQLRGEITPALRALAGRPAVTVANPDGAVSNAFPIHISPVILSVAPPAANAGSAAVPVTVTGLGLTAGDVLLWSAPNRQTVIFPTLVNSSKLTAVIPTELLGAPQSAAIQIVDAQRDLSSATSVAFDVLAVPTLVSLTPNPVDAGGAYFQLTVNGTGFVPRSVVNWAGTPIGTTYLSATQLQAAITPELRALSGSFPVTVSDPGVATSNAMPFTVSPVLFSVDPAWAAAGGPAVNLTATGVGFTRNAVLTFNGAVLVTTYVNSTLLSAALPATLLRTAGSAVVQVADSTGSGHSLAQPFSILPAPSITTLVPNSATAGSPGFTITVNSANCAAACTVQWNGTPLTTSRLSDTVLTAAVPASLLATAGVAAIRLANQGGGLSNSATFTINPAAAYLNSLSPNAVAAGSDAFPLTVYGSGFVPGSVVRWNGSSLPTSNLSATQLTATVSAELVSIRAGVSAAVTVLNPGGAESNTLTLAIDPPRPAILSLSPSSAAAGSPSVAIAITGSNFASNCVARWNGTAVETTFVDARHVTAYVPGSLLVNAGVIPVTVTNPSGMTASPATFTVIPSTPMASAVSPPSVTEGSATFTLMVTGAYFTPASIVMWNGSSLATTFASTAQLTAAVPANLVAAAGSASITVSNPGRLVSKAVAFVIASAPPATVPAPAITPGGVGNTFSSMPVIAPGALISIYGTNLASGEARATGAPLPDVLNGTSVSINGVAAPLLFVSAAQINAQVPWELAAGSADVVVRSGSLNSAAAKVAVAAAAPGILVAGTDALAVNFPAGTLNSALTPAHTGDYVVVYLTGQGRLDRPVPSGGLSPADPLSLPLAAVSARLGGRPVEVAFAGMAPGYVGLLQVNLLVPDVPAGEQSLEVTVGDVPANAAALWVTANH